MLKVIISPAKKMKIRNDILPYKNIPFFIKEAEKLFSYMGNMSFDELKDLWKCSDKLVEENERQFRIDSSRLSENTEDPRKFNIPWVFSFCQNLRICV